MCGFAFAYRPDVGAGTLRAGIQAATETLAHRGPDDQDIICQGGWAMGHRRLAVVDLGTSRQPMSDPEGRFHLAYNGEIYNYNGLRQQLSGRWAFRTQGDTEVLLAGLILDGPEFLQRAEGMWAFALWDAQMRELVLGRDRMGKKPLYYEQAGERFACASELPALRRLAIGQWTEDTDSTADFLRYGYCLPGYTCYAGVREVLPGHVARWSPAGHFSQMPYWQIQPVRGSIDHREALARVRATLERSVRRRLVADVEVGAFLSGGVDSSLVCALAAPHLQHRLQTFTIGFREAAFDERPYARLAATALGTEHHEEVLDGWDEHQLERLVLDHVGQPFGDASLLPTALVARVAADRVKVALSGDGGDELFSGYQRYQARALLRWYTRLPPPLRKTVEAAVRALPEPMAHHSRSLLKKAHLFLDVVARQKAEQPYVAPLMFAPGAFRELAPELAGRGHAPPCIPEVTGRDDIHQMMAADALVYLPQDILVKVDRASMAHGLETRAPFLDSELVSLAYSLPRRWHRRGFSGKRLLREACGPLLPGQLWRRRKQGFGVPLHAWFRGDLGRRFREEVSAHNGPLSQAACLRLLEEHIARRRDHGYRLWLIYVYLLWRRGLQ